ncbi:MAG: dihydropyrimidinase [Candidatus Hydrogenedentes bacterium CG07_land_8_20_14_0_80_42_17]|nr:MAG: dihydropyrimidinase [Candidatus Hydrogenedentes bacterium CG07_land_8_20_14_0_80_42_17]
MTTVIKGGRIVTASDSYYADIRIEGEKIAYIGKDLAVFDEDKIIDANGRWVIPGGIDPHVHMSLPFMGTVSKDDFDSGSAAALAGGTTMLFDFAIPPKGKSLVSAIEEWDGKANGKARCDYSYHSSITDWNEEIEREVPIVIEKYGINAFKIFTAYMGVYGIDDKAAFQAIKSVSRAGGLVSVHAVNGNVLVAMAEEFAATGRLDPIYHALSQPPEAEGEATHRVIKFAEISGSPIYIVHVSAKDSADEIAIGKKRGMAKVFGETCAQYLFLTQDLYELPNFEGSKYVLSPPLRPRSHCDALWKALQNHTIEIIGTDHCSFDFVGQKDMGRGDFRKIPNGLNGLEERLSMLYTYGVREGKISAERWVALCSTNASKIFGMYPKKGTIVIGADADIVLWDPDCDGIISAKTHKSRCDYNAYEGYRIKGRASTTFVRGQIAYENGEVKAEPGNGRFIKRSKFNPNCI